MENEKFEGIIHIARKAVSPYKIEDGRIFDTQRLSYDLTNQTASSIRETCLVLDALAERSKGEFAYWLTERRTNNIVKQSKNADDFKL